MLGDPEVHMKSIGRVACVGVLLGVGVVACSSGGGGKSPDDFLSNPVLQQAIKESGWKYTTGSSPPTVAGQYDTKADFSKANPSSIGGAGAQTVYCYYNQTASSVDSLETAPTIDPTYKSRGPGLLITGTGSDFTVWKDAHVTSSSCNQRTFVLFSASVGADKHLRGQFLTVVIEVGSGCGTVQPGWWKMAPMAEFTPNGTCTGQ
jgi:hypothetical protein